MSEVLFKKKSRKSVDARPTPERVQPDKNLNTVSEPKRDMIMPREFNSVSDPKIKNDSYSQTSNTFLSDPIF